MNIEDILYVNDRNQEKKGLKITTLNQMLSRLLITLAQLKAGYNSEKLTNIVFLVSFKIVNQNNL